MATPLTMWSLLINSDQTGKKINNLQNVWEHDNLPPLNQKSFKVKKETQQNAQDV